MLKFIQVWSKNVKNFHQIVTKMLRKCEQIINKCGGIVIEM